MPRTYPPKMKGRMIDFSDEGWEVVRTKAKASGMSMGAFVRWATANAEPVPLETDHDYPPVAGLVGSDPDFTGGKSAEGYVREMRDDDAREAPVVPEPGSLTDRYVEAIKSSVEPPSPQRGNNGCPHPKANRRQLAYGTFCDNCQDMVR